MRADRLLALLLLLQAKGRCSARELAEELEVSERTIYRDMTALSSAGVPVYAETGRNGGFALVDRYRTDLTGLSGQETQALTLALLAHNIPRPLAELGMGGDLQSALRKLSAALPQRFRSDEQRVRERFVLDPAGWDHDQETPNLPAVHLAVWGDKRLLIRYTTISGGISEQVVDAYGLVAKAGVWYLVYARLGYFQARRLTRLLSALVLDETFPRAEDFDLNEFWQAWAAQRQERSPQFMVRARIRRDFIVQLRYYLGEQTLDEFAETGGSEDHGWLEGDLNFETFESARSRILSAGSAVQVLEPLELRVALQDYAQQVLSLYAEVEFNRSKPQKDCI